MIARVKYNYFCRNIVITRLVTLAFNEDAIPEVNLVGRVILFEHPYRYKILLNSDAYTLTREVSMFTLFIMMR